jgi:hypothetical protein
MNTRLGTFVVLALMVAANPLWSAEEPCPCSPPSHGCLRRLLDRLHPPNGGCTVCRNDRLFVCGNEYQFFREFYLPLPPQPPAGTSHVAPDQ